MSFSSEVKEELSEQIASGRHCRLAETAAILSLCGKIVITENDRYCVKIQTENLAVARKYFTLLRKTFNIRAEVSVRKSREVRFYSVIVSKDPEARRLLGETCLLDEDGNVSECMSPMHHRLLRQNCCRRAFIRGAFLAVGSVSDPEKSYHFEIVCTAPEKARQLQELLASYDVDAKVVLRKRHYVVYIKEGSQGGQMDYKKAKLAHNHLTEELADKIKAAGYDDLLLMTAGPYKGNSCLSAYCVNAQMMADAAGMICWNDDDKVRYFSLILFNPS